MALLTPPIFMRRERAAALVISLALLTACGAGSGSQPKVCPEPAATCPPVTPCPEPTEPKVVKVPGRCPPCPMAPQKVGVRVAPATCVTGQVSTAGDMVFVVQRAKVTVLKETAALGSTWTDNQGRYVWCGATGSVGSGRKITIMAEKSPFRPAKQTITWEKGQHASADFKLEAEGLTTPIE